VEWNAVESRRGTALRVAHELHSHRPCKAAGHLICYNLSEDDGTHRCVYDNQESITAGLSWTIVKERGKKLHGASRMLLQAHAGEVPVLPATEPSCVKSQR
jgi:hypothetical protein